MERAIARSALVDDAFAELERIQNQCNPLVPFMKNEETFQRLKGPQTQGENWVKEMKRDAERKFVSEDPEVFGIYLSQRKTIPYSLKFKLRDHVNDLFSSLARLDKHQPKCSVSKSTFVFDDNMKRELEVLETGHQKRTNENSRWAAKRQQEIALGQIAKK